MPIVYVPQIDEMIKDFGKRLKGHIEQANKDIEQAIKEINEFREGNKMLHNVTVKNEENKLLEQYWVMTAVKKDGKYPIPYSEEFREKKLDHEPTTQEIAQFLHDRSADYVCVAQRYRFEEELPFN